MAGDPFRHVSVGTPFKGFPAMLYNTLVDMAKRFNQDRAGGAGEKRKREGMVRVQNNSGSDLGRFSILGIDSVPITPTANANHFKETVAFTGTAPNVPDPQNPAAHESDHRNRFVILAEPIADGSMGWAFADSLCVCQVSVSSDVDYRSALPIDGDMAKLEASDYGSVPLLWRETGTGTKWAVVALDYASQLISGLTLQEGDSVSGDPLWRELWAVVPTVLDSSAHPQTGQESNLSGGVRPDAQDYTRNYASRTVHPVISDYTNVSGVLAPDMRTCNHFSDGYCSQSPTAETKSGPLYFTAQTPPGGFATDAFHKPDFVATFKGRDWWDSTNTCFRPVVPIGCADVAALLGFEAVCSSIEYYFGDVIAWVQNVALSLATAVVNDFTYNSLPSPNVGAWAPEDPPADSVTRPCEGATSSWSHSDDVPRCT